MIRVAFSWVSVSVLVLVAGCAASGGGGPGRGARDAGPGGGGAMDAGPGGGGPRDASISGPFDGSRYLPPDPSAFFEMDPPPMYCGPDGGAPMAMVPGGTPDCPDDKNREGCRCDMPGMTAACWPGLRVDRARGICRDGTTTCMPWDEFGGRWGPCVGAVLPVAGATRGPEACNCFSAGSWVLDNLSPCFVTYGTTVYAVSTFIDASGTAACPTMLPSMPPPTPEPGTNWTTNRLQVDCAGQFHLCYTLKAGNAMTPLATDCTVAQVCTDAWYPTRDAMLELPPLPSWTSMDTVCAARFNSTGGYGEMSVDGTSIECDPVGDGAAPYVFNRVSYCPSSCSMTPTAPECVMCGMGGSGMF